MAGLSTLYNLHVLEWDLCRSFSA